MIGVLWKILLSFSVSTLCPVLFNQTNKMEKNNFPNNRPVLLTRQRVPVTAQYLTETRDQTKYSSNYIQWSTGREATQHSQSVYRVCLDALRDFIADYVFTQQCRAGLVFKVL